MTTPEILYRRNAVEPIQCIKAAWELVKDQYWLFVGMCLIGLMIGSAVPLGILLGPMMCGLFLTFFKRRRGELVEFGTLFKGFDYFGPSLIATLLHIIPILAIVIPAYFMFYVSLMVSIAAQGNEPNPAAMFGVLGMFGLFWVVMIFVIIIISIGFTFAYPLIVDRRLQGFDAVKLSFKAAMANFWRLLAMVILTSLMSIGGILLCYVGMFLVLPISYAAIASAYEQVFGLANITEASNLPPPPPTFN
jgi:Predicted integral membrane protein